MEDKRTAREVVEDNLVFFVRSGIQSEVLYIDSKTLPIYIEKEFSFISKDEVKLAIEMAEGSPTRATRPNPAATLHISASPSDAEKALDFKIDYIEVKYEEFCDRYLDKERIEAKLNA